MNLKIDPCPNCRKMPEKWVEPARFKSHQVCWLACKEHGIMAGGYSALIAIQNWNREVAIAAHKKTGVNNMKLIALAVTFLVLVGNPARAYDTDKNPDKVPSFGLDLWKGQVIGMDRQTSETNGGTVGGVADFRLPVSNALTVHFFGESEGVNNNLKYTDGYKIGLGMRVFLQ